MKKAEEMDVLRADVATFQKEAAEAKAQLGAAQQQSAEAQKKVVELEVRHLFLCCRVIGCPLCCWYFLSGSSPPPRALRGVLGVERNDKSESPGRIDGVGCVQGKGDCCRFCASGG